MNRKFPPSDTLDFIARLPVGALLRIEDKAFTNPKFREITGYCQESPSLFEECMELLFGERSDEMLRLFELDRRNDFHQSRIVSIQTRNGNERWVEWRGIQNKEEEILLFWDINHLWNTRIALMNRNRALEDQLLERTEELEKAVNLLLSNYQKVEKNKETSRLLAEILSVNQQLLKVLSRELPPGGSPGQDILEECSLSLQQMRRSCLGNAENTTLKANLQAMQKLLVIATRNPKPK